MAFMSTVSKATLALRGKVTTINDVSFIEREKWERERERVGGVYMYVQSSPYPIPIKVTSCIMFIP